MLHVPVEEATISLHQGLELTTHVGQLICHRVGGGLGTVSLGQVVTGGFSRHPTEAHRAPLVANIAVAGPWCYGSKLLFSQTLPRTVVVEIGYPKHEPNF